MNTLRWTDAPEAQRILTLAVSLAALVGTLLLCVGQGDFTLAVVVGCAVCVSFYLTEWTGILRLSPFFANLGAVAAMTLAGLDAYRGGREFLLFAIANLLVYLQIILLFQQKTTSVYWHIILLSLLQVVVGAALSLSASFGVMLLGFIVLSAFALHVFFLAEELGQLQFGPDGRGVSPALATGPEAPPGADRRGDPSGQAAASRSRRWPYADRRLEFAAAPTGADRRGPGGLRRFISTTLRAVGVAVPLAAMVFFVTPRMGTDPWRGGPAEQQRVVGFSQEVRLGELGAAAENPEIVMRVKFIDPRTGKGFQLENTPLLRGTVVTRYDQGKWTHHATSSDTTKEDLERPPRRSYPVTQEIALEPLNEPVVFSVYPAYSSRQQPVAYDVDLEQIVRQPERLQQAQLNLRLETTGFAGHRQLEITPAEGRRQLFYLTYVPRHQDGSRSLRTVRAVAEQVLRDAGLLDADPYVICKTLERYLQRDGGFTYTLTAPPLTPGLDPVEDFVANSRSGNCEFFASALALMLRSRDIPTRVVIGYQGGEWNSVGQYYQFRQLHAHSWVEAYLSRDEAAKYVDNPGLYRRGGWLRLDPTPVTLAPQDAESAGVLSSFRQIKDYAELVWVKYIAGMTSRRQREVLYLPIQTAIGKLLDPVTFVTSIEATLRNWVAAFRDWLGGNWFSWRGGIAASVVCLVGAGAYRSGRWVLGTVRRRKGRGGARDRSRGSVVPFYARLERLFAGIGIQRTSQETQREFAMSLAGHLAESTATSVHAGLPRRIADAYYGVRFGGQPLSPAQEQELEAALGELETAIRQK